MTLRDAIAHLEEEQKALQAQAKPADPVIAADIQKLLGYRQWMASSSDGPLWYRGLTKDAEPTVTAGLEALLARFGARYMVVGHTVMAKATVTPWLAEPGVRDRHRHAARGVQGARVGPRNQGRALHGVLRRRDEAGARRARAASGQDAYLLIIRISVPPRPYSTWSISWLIR